VGSRDREFISDIIEENGRLLEYLKSSKFTLSRDRVSINQSLFNRIKMAQISYTKLNDEVPLAHTLKLLKRLKFKELRDEIDNILHYGGFSSSKYYTFKRDENGRVRTLHALGARDKVITTLL